MNRFVAFPAIALCASCVFVISVNVEVLADELLEKKQIAKALKLTTADAQTYQLNIVGDESGSNACALNPKPVLKWSNPVAGNIHGNVFLWTNQKQPVAVGSFYKWFSPWTHSSHEFHSLSTRPLNAAFKETNIWSPQTAGITWKNLADSSSPAKSGSPRLIQMRRIAKQFSVTKSDREETDRNMRLLAQPVYRYESPELGVTDGALFVFVQGTDPELWLMIEAFDPKLLKIATASKQTAATSKQQLQWRYALARMNTTKFVVQRNDKTIQTFPVIKWAVTGVETNGYFKINTDKLP